MPPTELKIRPSTTSEIGSDRRSLSPEDQKYWKENNPKAIVFASSSIRKAILLAFALSGYDRDAIKKVPFLEKLPFDPTLARTPLELQQLIEQHIPNGNGELQNVVGEQPTSIYVGEYRGVPVYMVSQEGETDKNNDPRQQSSDKISDVQRTLGEKPVLIFGSDSTGLIGGEHLGKPRQYPKEVGRFKRGAQDVVFTDPSDVAEYCAAYLEKFYFQDTETVHNNALVAVRPVAAEQQNVVVRETSLTRQIKGVQARLDQLQIYLDAGGGGLFQQFVDWYGNILDEVSDIYMREAVAQLPEEQRPWAVICHIMGMPAWALPAVFEELTTEIA